MSEHQTLIDEIRQAHRARSSLSRHLQECEGALARNLNVFATQFGQAQASLQQIVEKQEQEKARLSQRQEAWVKRLTRIASYAAAPPADDLLEQITARQAPDAVKRLHISECARQLEELSNDAEILEQDVARYEKVVKATTQLRQAMDGFTANHENREALAMLADFAHAHHPVHRFFSHAEQNAAEMPGELRAIVRAVYFAAAQIAEPVTRLQKRIAKEKNAPEIKAVLEKAQASFKTIQESMARFSAHNAVPKPPQKGVRTDPRAKPLEPRND